MTPDARNVLLMTRTHAVAVLSIVLVLHGLFNWAMWDTFIYVGWNWPTIGIIAYGLFFLASIIYPFSQIVEPIDAE